MPEYTRGDYLISTDPGLLDLDSIYAFVSRSYWGLGRPKEIMKRALENSLCFGIYDLSATGTMGGREHARQIGLVRVVTDHAVFAYLCDVYILEEYRRQGLGKWLLETVMAYPDLQGLRRLALCTRDAHDFYRKYGFQGLESPGKWMELFTPYHIDRDS